MSLKIALFFVKHTIPACWPLAQYLYANHLPGDSGRLSVTYTWYTWNQTKQLFSRSRFSRHCLLNCARIHHHHMLTFQVAPSEPNRLTD